MSFDTQIYYMIAVILLPQFVLVFLILRTIERVMREIESEKQVTNRYRGRLSVTFMKIENDLLVLMDCISILGQSDDLASAKIGEALQKRHQWLKKRLEYGPVAGDLLRGLEFPDIDNDPFFWAKDRTERIVPEAFVSDLKP